MPRPMSRRADAENARRLVEGDHLARLVVGPVQCGEFVVAAVRPYTVGVPGEPRAGADANPVEGQGDVLVGEASRHLRDDLRGLLGADAAMARGALPDSASRVDTAPPVNDGFDGVAGLVDVGNDLLDESAHDALLEAHVRRRVLPYPREVRAQREQLLDINGPLG